MNILLAEDETGIREGLATFLRLKGHVVRTAGSYAAARDLIVSESFDVIVTDWRLGDGLGGQVVEGFDVPVVVMTGYPEEVTDLGDRATILCKPVTPSALLAEVEGGVARGAVRPAPEAERLHDASALDVAELPRDTRDRLRLAWALAGCDPEARVLDEGDIVTLEAVLQHDDDPVLSQLGELGGDLRVLVADGVPRLELRLYRDGRPDGSTLVRWDERWPEAPEPVAVNLDGDRSCDPVSFVELVERVADEASRGRTVDVLNIPAWLRLHLEITDRGHLLPKRPRSGPRLPEVLMELWSQG